MPRHGDAETGYGMDLGGPLAWTDRTLLAHVVHGLSVTDDGIGGVRIRARDIATFFQPTRTALLTLQLNGQQAAETFRFGNG